jgi:hypothetical protein
MQLRPIQPQRSSRPSAKILHNDIRTRYERLQSLAALLCLQIKDN